VNEASWVRHWTRIPEFTAGWDAYVALREAADGDEPAPTPVQRQAGISGDRSRVSRWIPLYRARWTAEHGVNDAPAAATGDATPDARRTVNGATLTRG
jgi:hypothetical protein